MADRVGGHVAQADQDTACRAAEYHCAHCARLAGLAIFSPVWYYG